jgi:hypothetical protein
MLSVNILFNLPLLKEFSISKSTRNRIIEIDLLKKNKEMTIVSSSVAQIQQKCRVPVEFVINLSLLSCSIYSFTKKSLITLLNRKKTRQTEN